MPSDSRRGRSAGARGGRPETARRDVDGRCQEAGPRDPELAEKIRDLFPALENLQYAHRETASGVAVPSARAGGELVQRVRSTQLRHTVAEPGIHRVEVYRRFLGRKVGWIFSSPIYVI